MLTVLVSGSVPLHDCPINHRLILNEVYFGKEPNAPLDGNSRESDPTIQSSLGSFDAVVSDVYGSI